MMRGPSIQDDPVRGRWRRLLGTLALVAGLLVAGLCWRHSADLGAFWRHGQGSGPRLTANFDALSGAMDEAGLGRHFGGLPLRCADMPGPTAPDGQVGARVCLADVDRIDGVPAMQLSARWDAGRLTEVRIDLPWWAHHAALRWLVANTGAPTTIDLRPVAGATVAWRVRAGVVELNRDPGWDPLQTSALRWRAEASAPRATPS